MKLGKRYLACLILAVVMVVSLGLFAACNGNKPSDSSSGNGSTNSTTSSGTQSTDPVKTPEELKGEYYCLDGAKEYKLSFEDEMAVKLNLGDGDKQATFTFDGTKATWLYDGKTTTAKLSADGSYIDVKVDKSTYTFWRKVNYTVTYSADGVTIEPSTTLNGTVAKKPTDPSKQGYYFVGWYKDAEFKETYSFESDVITKDTTLYGRFIEYLANEFDVNFDLAYENAPKMDTVKTVQHKLEYNLPTPTRDGYKFIGWWTSAYDTAEKLTAKYTNQEIKKNGTTLYAVWEANDANGGIYVSYDENGIKWNSVDVNVTYTITITRTNEGDEVQEGPLPTQKIEYAYAMNDLPAGDYMVEVKGKNFTGVAYYKNKALDAVSEFIVDDTGTLLTWKAVDNATSYYVSYECAGDAHSHVEFNNGDSTNFNFKNCDMPEGGFKFTIKALANGYSTSVSEVFTFDKALDAAQNLAVADGTKLTWDAVKNAQYYEVKVSDNTYYALTNEYSLENMTGALEIYVTAKARTFAPSTATKLDYTRQMLVAPQNVKVNGGEVTWDAVNGATSYVVTVDGKEVSVTTNAFTLEQGTHFDATLATHTLTVQAKADTDATKSLKTKAINFTVDTVNPLIYEDGKLYWAMVDGATKYLVKVNNGKALELTANDYFAKVDLTQEGENTLQVAYVNAENVSSAWASLKVEAVSLKVELGAGAYFGDNNTLYYEKGTLIDLNEIKDLAMKDSYSFAGWYAVKNGRINNAAKYYDNVPVELNSNMTLYGAWLGEKRKITLDLEGATLPEGTPLEKEVNIGEKYELPVPTLDDATKYFVGWYTEPNGMGSKCTDDKGQGFKYLYDVNKTLYPRFENILEFTQVNNNDSQFPKAYAVSQGPAIKYVDQIVIPEMYKGLPVTTIEANGFKDCKSLKSFSIPSSIKNVEKTAFDRCTNLAEVMVYAVEGAPLDYSTYYSSQGVLIRRDSSTGSVEVAFVPAAKTGHYDIPYGVTTIPAGTFKSKELTSLTIPATVTYIGKEAFYNISSGKGFTKIEFLAQENEADEVPLTIAQGAFYYCNNITTLDLPARMELLPDTRWFGDIFFGTTSTSVKIESVNITGNPVKETVTNADGTETKKDVVTYTSKDGIVYDNKGTTLVYFPYARGGQFTTPSGVTVIKDHAFYKNNKIYELTISYDVTSIEKQAFYGCIDIVKLTFLGDENTLDLTIGEEAFYDLRGLTELELPACIKQIDKYAFASCSKLKTVSVDFDSRIVNNDKIMIDQLAFTNSKGDTYITTLYMGENVPALDITGIFGGYKLEKVDVDSKNTSYGLYKDDGIIYGKDENGNLVTVAFCPITKSGVYEVPLGIKNISPSVFASRKLITEIKIPHTVIDIGKDAFYYCSALTKVTFLPTPDGEEVRQLSIGAEAFSSCNKLTELDFPERTVELGDKLIDGSNNIVTIKLPASLKTLNPTTDKDGNVSMETFYSGDKSRLSKIEVSEDSKDFVSVDGILYKLKEVPAKKEGEPSTYVPSELIICPLQNNGKDGNVVVPATVNRIWDKAFRGNSLITSIEFEDRTADDTFELGNHVFNSMTALKQLQLPYGLKELKTAAISHCDLITEIYIPQTVETVNYFAIITCDSLEKVIFLDDGKKEENKACDLTFVGGSKAMEQYSFVSGCPNLKLIQLPKRGYKPAPAPIAPAAEGDTTTEPTEPTTPTHGDLAEIEIGQYTFKSVKVEKIILTDNVVSIGKYAFQGATIPSLDIPKSVKTIEQAAFTEVKGLKTITFPEDLTIIAQKMFQKAEIESFVVGPNITKIDKYAFDESTIANLTFATKEVKNEDGTTSQVSELEEIADYAFNKCEKLQAVTFPNSLKKIGQYSFRDNTSLQSVVISTSVETIVKYAFDGDTALSSLTFEGTPENKSNLTSIGDYAFGGIIAENIVLPSSNKSIELGSQLFGTTSKKNTTLKTLYISESVISMTASLANCVALETVTVSEDSQNFATAKGLPYITNKDGTALRYYYGRIDGTVDLFNGGVDEEGNKVSKLEVIDDRVFEGQEGLTSIVIPRTITSIGIYAFNKCTNLQEVIFEKGSKITQLKAYTFAECKSLTKIEIPSTVTEMQSVTTSTTIYGGVFKNCSKLETVTFEQGSELKAIGEETFYQCGMLKNIVLPETLETIGEEAFYYCKSLSEINLPASLTTIVKKAFHTCSSLKTVHFPTSTQYTALPDYMFYSCTALKTSTINNEKQEGFVLPESITEIGSNAFNKGTSLTKITLSPYTTSIGSSAFYDSGLLNIELPDSVDTIGSSAFSGAMFTEITLPKSLTDEGFGASAFKGCDNLTTVDFTNATALTKLPNSAFENDIKLQYIIKNGKKVDFEIPANIEELGSSVLSNTGITKLVVPGTLTKIGASAFAKNALLEEVVYKATLMSSKIFEECTALKVVKFDAASTINVTAGTYAFSKCSALKYSEYTDEKNNKPFAFPAGITQIPNYFLAGELKSKVLKVGAGIETIEIPATVTKIGTNVFDYCVELTTVKFAENSKVTNIGNYAFRNCEKLTTLNNLPKKVTTVGTNMFQNCVSLTEFTIPSGWAKVSSNMFNGCEKLATVTFELDDKGVSSVNLIDNYAFANCPLLGNVTIPEKVTKIGTYAFLNNSTITEVTIPKLVTTIDTSAFENCSKLATVTFTAPDKITKIGGSAFKKCVALTTIALPKKLFGTSTSPSSTTYKEVFAGCTTLESVTFAEGTNYVTIPKGMFDGCTSLKSIVLPKTVTKIDENVFRNCEQLESVTFAEGVNNLKEIGKCAFMGCVALKSFDLPDTLTKLGESAFEGCKSLSVNIADAKLTQIPKNAFKDCTNLTSFTIPATVETIGESAFENTGLASISLPATVTALDEYVFANTALTEFDIPETITEISATAFAGCLNLANFNISEGNLLFKFANGMLFNSDGEILMYLASNMPENGTLTITKDMKIGPKAFAGAKNITTVIFEDGVTAIPEYALYDADSVKTVVIPATVTSIGAYAFAECDMLESVSMPNSVKTLGTKVVSEDGATTTYTGYVFANTPMLKTLTLGTAVEEIMPHTFDGSALTSIALPDSLTTICDFGFFNATKLESVTFGANANYIGKYAFTQCLALPEITITGKDMVIADYAFASVEKQSATEDEYEPMPNLKTVTLGEGVKSVGIAAFRGTGVETLNVGATVEVIDNYAFNKVATLKTLNIAQENSKLQRIGSYAFQQTALTSVVLPEGLVYVGAEPTINATTGLVTNQAGYVFHGCKSLVSVKLPTTLKSIGTYTFSECEELLELDITATEYVGGDIVSFCTKLKKVHMADGPKILNSASFEECTALEELTLPNTITNIYGLAFKNCSSIKELYIPETCINMVRGIFSGFTEKTTIYFVNIPEPLPGWDGEWNIECSAKFVFDAKPKGENQTQPDPQPQPQA